MTFFLCDTSLFGAGDLLICKYATEGKLIDLNESRPGKWKLDPNWKPQMLDSLQTASIPTHIPSNLLTFPLAHRPGRFAPSGLTHDGELARPLLGGDDLQGGGDGLDADDGLVGVVGARHGQLQVSAHQQLGRDVLELQRGELQRTDGRTDEQTDEQINGFKSHQ